jgi:hypothetical protein
MKSMCCLCIQVTHENTSECTILHLVNNKILAPPPSFQVWLLALLKRLATPLTVRERIIQQEVNLDVSDNL